MGHRFGRVTWTPPSGTALKTTELIGSQQKAKCQRVPATTMGTPTSPVLPLTGTLSTRGTSSATVRKIRTRPSRKLTKWWRGASVRLGLPSSVPDWQQHEIIQQAGWVVERSELVDGLSPDGMLYRSLPKPPRTRKPRQSSTRRFTKLMIGSEDAGGRLKARAARNAAKVFASAEP